MSSIRQSCHCGLNQSLISGGGVGQACCGGRLICSKKSALSSLLILRYSLSMVLKCEPTKLVLIKGGLLYLAAQGAFGWQKMLLKTQIN
jgi:hypothetical protein